MKQRITLVELNQMVDKLNLATNSPRTYSTLINKKFNIHVGHYSVGGAYGGYRLERTATTSGAVDVISQDGYGTKRQLHTFLSTFSGDK